MKKGLRLDPAFPEVHIREVVPSPNCCPDEEGIKTISSIMLISLVTRRVRIAALMKKGLRLEGGRLITRLNPWSVRIAALMKKGLRLVSMLEQIERKNFPRPNCCPDEEGIKTIFPQATRGQCNPCPNCCPDEEGIKTNPCVCVSSFCPVRSSELLP